MNPSLTAKQSPLNDVIPTVELDGRFDEYCKSPIDLDIAFSHQEWPTAVAADHLLHYYGNHLLLFLFITFKFLLF